MIQIPSQLQSKALLTHMTSIFILSDITGRTPDLQCRFENRWKARLLRTGGPIVQFIVDLGPYVDLI